MKSDLPSTVIILGVDTPIGVAILRDLGKHNYTTIGIGRSRNAIGFASRHCHISVVRETKEDALIAQLTALGKRFPGASLLAVSEADLMLLNRYRNELEKQLVVIAPPEKMLHQVLDKDISISLAQKVGIRTPHTFNPEDIETIERQAQHLTYPRVLKWSDPNQVQKTLSEAGLTLKKCEYASNASELVAKLQPFAKIGRFPMIQEYCPGKGIGQMFLVKEGEIILQFQHERIHEWPPEGGFSTHCKSIPLHQHKECRERSIALLKLLKWEGVAMVEYRYDSTSGEYFFMEINGRFWGSLPLAISAGVPFAAELVRSFQTGYRQKPQSKYSVVACRFMIPESRRLFRLIFQPDKISDPSFQYHRAKEIRDYFINFIKRDIRYYIFCLTDPGPFLKDSKNVLKKAIRQKS